MSKAKTRKKRAKINFTNVVTTAALIILIYAAAMGIFSVFIIGILFTIGSLFGETSILKKICGSLIGLLLVAFAVAVYKYFTRSKKKTSKQKPKFPKLQRFKGVGLLGLFVIALAASLPGAIYWTGSAIGGIRTDNIGVETTAKVTIDSDWNYPLTLVNGRLIVLLGKPVDDYSASVRFMVGDKEYTSHTMVALTSKVRSGETSIRYNPNNPEQVTTTTLIGQSIIQSVLFDGMAIIFLLASILHGRLLLKNKASTTKNDS